MIITTAGLDPSLAHGVLVKARWDIGKSKTRLDSYDVLYEWGPKKSAEDPLTRDSTPTDIERFSSGLLTLTVPLFASDESFPRIPLAVDWDEKAVMWRGQSILAGKVSFMVGYLVRGFQSVGLPVMILTPREVRSHFNLNQRADKKALWNEVDFFPSKSNSDFRDSLLLSYVLAVSLASGVRKAIGEEGGV